MRGKLLLTLGLAACLVASAVGLALAAKPTVVREGNMVLKINGSVRPKALPKGRLAPIALRASGRIGTNDGTTPPAVRKVIVDFDKRGTVNAKGLQACRPGQLQARRTEDALKACKGALVGRGKTEVVVDFADQEPFTATGPLLLFNGGVKGDKTRMYIHAYVNVPTPTALVTNVVIKKIKKGRYGTRAIARIPEIANGAGKVTFFRFEIDRKFRRKGEQQSYLVARCANGRFYAHAKSFFDDGRTAGGTIVRPCRKRG
ncbi:MAG: hypothetical protein R2725_15565 [Solirubrobacterales bacterium]